MNVYDFDNTIYAGDSTIDFYLYCIKRNKLIIAVLPIQIYAFIMYVLGFYCKKQFKEKFFSFLKKIVNIDEVVEEFWNINIYKINKWYINQHNRDDIVISASPEFLLNNICKRLEIEHLIATKVCENSGRFLSDNCYGQEKVNRFTKEFPNMIIGQFYSDSTSDSPMAELAQEAYLVMNKKIIPWEEGIKKKRIFISREFIRFLLVGVINIITGIVFSIIYSRFLQENIAFIIGYMSSLMISYILNSKIVFRKKMDFRNVINFVLSYVPNFIIQNATVIIIFNILEWNKIFAYVLAAILGVPLTFILLKLFTFKNIEQ